MIKQVLHTFLTKIISSAAGFATIIIISQILGAEQKGEQAMIVLNVYILMLVFTLIGNSTLIYLTPRYRFSLLIIPSFLWIAVFSMFSLCFIFIFPNLVPQYSFSTLTIAIFASISEINQFVLLGKQKIEQANKVKLLSPLLTAILLLFFWMCGWLNSIGIFILSLAISYFVSTVYSIFLLRKQYQEVFIDFPKHKDFLSVFKLILTKSIIKQISSIMQTLNHRVLFYIMAFYFGKSIVGVYSNAVSLTEAVMLFGSSLALVQYSKLSNTYDNVSSRQLTLKMTKINAGFTFIALLILCILPSGVYVWLFGEDFLQVGYIIRLLSFGILLLSCSSNFTQYFASQGNFSISAFASLVGLIITFSLGLWLVPLYDITGAALTMIASFSLSFFIEYIYFCHWKNKYLLS